MFNNLFRSKRSKITIVGSGYVGMAMGALIAKRNDVIITDIDKKRVSLINQGISTVRDPMIDSQMMGSSLSLSSTSNIEKAYVDAEFIIIATPTNYNEKEDCFDTSSVNQVIADILKFNNKALIVIKSTIPIGHTRELQEIHNTDRIIFSPEFLREGSALYDNLYPSRIVIGSNLKAAQKFSKILVSSAKKKHIQIIFTSSDEAEAIKLFANSYLALRVSFFNEIDSFSMVNNLKTKDIIDGVSADDRIGSDYNNPSFGYGGYCLPKDTKQLLSNFKTTPQNIIESIIESNKTRKDFLSREILKENPRVVGIYLLAMKQGSDNFRSTAVMDIIDNIYQNGVEIIIYEPEIVNGFYMNYKVVNDIKDFVSKSDIILANRVSKEINSFKTKVFSRDIFGDN